MKTTTRKVRRTAKGLYKSVSVGGKVYCPFDEPTGCILTTASHKSLMECGESVTVTPAGKDILGHGLVTVDCGDFAETWKEKVKLPEPKPEPRKRPVLVNVLTGERIEGEPGMSEDLLFGLYANGML